MEGGYGVYRGEGGFELRSDDGGGCATRGYIGRNRKFWCICR